MRKPPFPPAVPRGRRFRRADARGRDEEGRLRLAVGARPSRLRAPPDGALLQGGGGRGAGPDACGEPPALASLGLESRVRELNAGVLRLVAEGAGGLPVGARIGPSGIAFSYEEADCFDEIFAVYREQIRILDEAGASFSDDRASNLARRHARRDARGPVDRSAGVCDHDAGPVQRHGRAASPAHHAAGHGRGCDRRG